MKRTLIKDSFSKINKKIKICGFVEKIRDHGGLIFFNVRDGSGRLQVVVSKSKKVIYNTVKTLTEESTIEVIGIVQKRPTGTQDKDTAFGDLEVSPIKIKLFSKARPLPFDFREREKVKEEVRLKYRYLEFRDKGFQENFWQRQMVISFFRNFLGKRGFLEIETPILSKSTPEGARDFLVPSRLHPGKFYALPQSPQQYKQILMVGGVERYFQIVRCFRDEDPRADRQAEFTQLDIEMAFISQEEILNLVEEMYIKLVKKLFPSKKITQIPFPRLDARETIKKYKTDKPDLRKNKKDPDELAFAFLVDFPMFEWKKEEKRWDAIHHPFTRPQTEDIKEIKAHPENILAYQYDFILNGYEVGGGSLRSYKPEILEAVFEVMGNSKEVIRKQFGHLLEAFEYGVPPHGGIAPGIDRFLMIVLNQDSIRDVIAFPKTGDGRDLMMDAPSEVSKDQLQELKIKINKIKSK